METKKKIDGKDVVVGIQSCFDSCCADFAKWLIGEKDLPNKKLKQLSWSNHDYQYYPVGAVCQTNVKIPFPKPFDARFHCRWCRNRVTMLHFQNGSLWLSYEKHNDASGNVCMGYSFLENMNHYVEERYSGVKEQKPKDKQGYSRWKFVKNEMASRRFKAFAPNYRMSKADKANYKSYAKTKKKRMKKNGKYCNY